MGNAANALLVYYSFVLVYFSFILVYVSMFYIFHVLLRINGLIIPSGMLHMLWIILTMLSPYKSGLFSYHILYMYTIHNLLDNDYICMVLFRNSFGLEDLLITQFALSSLKIGCYYTILI